MKCFRELRVWEAAMNLVEKMYRLTRAFPKHETYVLSDGNSLGRQLYALRNSLKR